MSQELINAAASGNAARVVELLENPETNINFIGSFSKRLISTLYNKSDMVKGSALAAALINGHDNIAYYLLQRGAKVALDEENANGYLFDDAAFMNPLVLTTDIPMDLRLLKLFLSKCREVNPKVIWHKEKYQYFLIDKFKSDGRCKLNDRNIRLSYFFCEAVLRNDVFAIDGILQKSPEDLYSRSMEINDALFQEYLVDHKFTVAQAERANKGIDYLIEKRIVSPLIGALIKKLVEKNIHFEVELELFPKELQDALKQPAQRSLQELFCELQSRLYPENDLRSQNPIDLRRFLEMDESFVLMRLNYCSTETGENPAALLLAEILLRYHAAKVTVNEKDEPLLSEKHQKTCLKLLTKLYTMTDMEKLLLNANRQQFVMLTELRAQNERLAASVDEVRSNLDKLMKVLLQDKKEAKQSEVLERKSTLGMFTSA